MDLVALEQTRLSNKKILALDQAAVTTGWALFKNEELIDYGSFTVSKTLPIEQRLHEIQDNIASIIYEHGAEDDLDLIAFEGIQDQGNRETFRKLAMVQAAVLLLAYSLSIKTKVYSANSWRSILGGNFGRKREEQKEKAIQIVKEKYGIDVKSDIADAICIGLAAKRDSVISFE